jgi:hypothetical protein
MGQVTNNLKVTLDYSISRNTWFKKSPYRPKYVVISNAV